MSLPRKSPTCLLLQILLMLLLGGSSGCAALRAEEAPTGRSDRERIEDGAATPPFYRVEGRGGADLLLMGTLHVGPRQGWRFSREVLSGLREADGLVLEIDVRAVDEGAVGSILAATGLLPPSTLIEDVVDPRTAALMQARNERLTRMGFPRNARKRFEPWFLAIGLIERATAESGYPTGRSVEQALLERLDGRPLEPLESFHEQLAMLDGLSPSLQDLMLRDTLLRLDDTEREIEALMLAWAENDEAGLEAATYLGTDENPELVELFDVLLGDRNRRWLERLVGWLRDPERHGETLFVGVGAGHLVGPDNLVGLLRGGGYVVTAIEQTRPEARAVEARGEN